MLQLMKACEEVSEGEDLEQPLEDLGQQLEVMKSLGRWWEPFGKIC
jgi:hypothetical protein